MLLFDDDDDEGGKSLVNALRPGLAAVTVFVMVLLIMPAWLPNIEHFLLVIAGFFAAAAAASFLLAFWTLGRRDRGLCEEATKQGLVHKFLSCHWDLVRWAVSGAAVAVSMRIAVAGGKVQGEVLLDTIMLSLCVGGLFSFIRVVFMAMKVYSTKDSGPGQA